MSTTEATAEGLAERVKAFFETNPKAMTRFVARELGVPEADVVRHLPENRAQELDGAKVLDLIRAFEHLPKLYVIVSNGACVLECHGQFGNFSLTGPFFNVQTDTLDMHINHEKLATVFAVRKMGHMDGVETISFQFFDAQGDAAFKAFLTFGGQAPTPELEGQYTDLVTKYRKA